jgi:uncharacterized membrane protein
MGVTFVRLVTVHPSLVHVSIGAVPLLLVAYVVAAARRSTTWSFAGDLALFVATPFTVAAAAFGLVSRFALFWPDDLEVWRDVHLGLGVAATALLVLLAAWRIVRRREPVSTRFVAVLGLAALAIAGAGWVGGEQLVFHAGMAVRGGALGMLAPPLGSARAPRGFVDAMGRMRAHLAAVTDDVSEMAMDHPDARRFADAAGNARALAETARWLGAHPESFPERSTSGSDEERVAGHGGGTGGDRGRASDERGDADLGAADPALEIANYAPAIEELGHRLAGAAVAHDLERLAAVTGLAQATCAACHASVRWRSVTSLRGR